MSIYDIYVNLLCICAISTDIFTNNAIIKKNLADTGNLNLKKNSFFIFQLIIIKINDHDFVRKNFAFVQCVGNKNRN